MTSAQAKKALVADLRRSGLTLKNCTGWSLVNAQSMAKLFPKLGVEWAYRIPYPHTQRNACAPLCRYKILSWKPLAFGIEREESGPKYLQESKTVPGAYFHASYAWAACLDDPDVPLILTEGEKKAAKGCEVGFATIGLGGVWNWRLPNGLLIPELKAIMWAKRPVYICFDSDARTNPQVAAAIAALVKALGALGAHVHVATMPDGQSGAKTGLDDFLVAFKSTTLANEALQEHLRAHKETDALLQGLCELNTEYAVVRTPGMVVREIGTDLAVLDHAKFENLLEADRKAIEVVGNKKREVAVAKRWTEWSGRRIYERLTYDPGAPRVVNSTELNTWPGLGVKPVKGDISPWVRLLDHHFKDSPESDRLWFERWCGYPLKHLGAKMFSIAAFWGRSGNAKSIFAERTLGYIYDKNFTSVSQAEMEASFNGYAAKRQFILVDEVDAMDSRSLARTLKKHATQRTLRINEKFVPSYEVVDHVNFFLTSNSADAFCMDAYDRRYFVHHVPDEPLPAVFFDHYIYKWVGLQPNGSIAGPGLPALLHYFQNELSYGDFDPHRPPPMTASKKDMIEATMHPCEHWLRTFTEQPTYEASGNCQVWAASKLCALYRETSRAAEGMSPNWFGAHLSAAGLFKRQVCVDDRTRRLVAVTNFEKWKCAQPQELIAEYRRNREVHPTQKF